MPLVPEVLTLPAVFRRRGGVGDFQDSGEKDILSNSWCWYVLCKCLCMLWYPE